MPGVWNEENWFDLADYADLDMEGCIRAMEKNGRSSSSAGSHVADDSEVDRMDEDAPPLPVAQSEEPAIPISSECQGPLQARSFRPAKQVKKFQHLHSKISTPSMKSWLKDILL